MRLVQAKDRSIQQYLETSSKYGFWCNLKLAQESGLQFHQTRIVHKTHFSPFALRTRYIENEGVALPKGTLNSKISTGCTQSEFAQRSTRSTRRRH